MLIGCEWNDLCAGIEHDAANPFFADCVCKCLQSANIVSTQCCCGFYLNSYHPAGAILYHDVHFLARGRSPVEQLRPSRAPCTLLAQFHQDEILKYCSGQISF